MLRQVGYLQGSYQNARSTKQKIYDFVLENKLSAPKNQTRDGKRRKVDARRRRRYRMYVAVKSWRPAIMLHFVIT